MTGTPTTQEPPGEDYGAPSPRSTGRIAAVVFALLTLVFIGIVTWALRGMQVRQPVQGAPPPMQSTPPSST
jgi:hypothetical protein